MEKEIQLLKEEINQLKTRIEKIERLLFKEDSKIDSKIIIDISGVADITELEKITKSLVIKIDRTKYLHINKDLRNADLAMSILKIAKDYGYNGLLPFQIYEILKKKFELSIPVNSIRIALNREKKFVDKKSFLMKINNYEYFYVLSSKGEEHILQLFHELNSIER